MKQSVDKQKEEVLVHRVAVVASLAFSYCRAEDHLAASVADFVREHVRDIVLLAETSIESLRARSSGEHERDFPAGKRFLDCCGKRQTGHRAPGEIAYVERSRLRRHLAISGRGSS